MKKIFSYALCLYLAVCLFAKDGKSVSVIKSPHHIEAKAYEDGTCTIFIQLNKKMGALYIFEGIIEDSLIKYVKLLNAEFYEEEKIDRHRLTDWMNSKVAPAIKIESDDDDLVLGAISLFVSSTLKFELSEIKDDVYIYKIDSTLSKYFE